jgi:hypothetical protein
VTTGCRHGCFDARGSLATLLALGVASLATPVAAQSAGPQDAALAEALFRDAKQLVAEGRFDVACPKFEESMRLSPAGGTALNLAACHESQGRLATAWAEFNEAVSMARRDGRADRETLARTHLATIEPRLPRLTLAAGSETEPPDLEIKLDGVLVRRASLGTAVPVDPGQHRVIAAAPGRVPWETVVQIGEGERLSVAIPALLNTPAPAGPDTPSERPDDSRSHAWRPGLLARVDVDGKGRGAAATPLVTMGLGDYVELGAGPMLGRTLGAYVGSSFFVLKNAWKPLLTLGLPIFASNGPRPGVHGAAGLSWDPHRHFGVLVEAGIEYFPNAQMGYDKLLFVPSAGVQGRL